MTKTFLQQNVDMYSRVNYAIAMVIVWAGIANKVDADRSCRCGVRGRNGRGIMAWLVFEVVLTALERVPCQQSDPGANWKVALRALRPTTAAV